MREQNRSGSGPKRPVRTIMGALGLLLVWVATAGMASAVTIPFSEDFDMDVSGWEDNASDPLFWESTGGPDGGAFASADFNYFGFSSPFGGGPVIFRASSADMASGNAFVGDWLNEGVMLVTAFVRHDAPEDLSFFLRVATSFNFPGAVINSTQSVAPNTWTQVYWTIDPNNPLCIGESVTCAEALEDVGNLQVGTNAPMSLTGLDQAFMLDIDKVTVVPEPSVGLMLGAGLAGMAIARRTRRL